MSEFRADSISPEDLEKIPEPTEADWRNLQIELEQVKEHFKGYNDEISKIATEGWALRNVSDVGNNIIAATDILFQVKDPKYKSADNYYKAVKKIEALKKYFYLLDNFSDFKTKEFTSSGMAFPEVEAKYRGQDEAVSADNYLNDREAYIYESAKLLEQTKNNQAA